MPRRDFNLHGFVSLWLTAGAGAGGPLGRRPRVIELTLGCDPEKRTGRAVGPRSLAVIVIPPDTLFNIPACPRPRREPCPFYNALLMARKPQDNIRPAHKLNVRFAFRFPSG